MKGASALVLILISGRVVAATAYVSDELILGVFAERNSQEHRLATLHSGARVETLSVSGEFTEVRLGDETTTGWVKSNYLTTKIPATVRVKQLEEELDRSRATAPAQAEAAARSEVQQLERELAGKQAELDARGAAAPAADAPAKTPTAPAGALRHPGIIGAAAVLAALAAGFWLGYATLARRVRHKFGGIKVY